MKRDTILTLKLPGAGGSLEDYAVREPKSFRRPPKPFTRRALAAAHVVADPFSTREPWLEPAIDWDATIAYRRHLWSWGLGVAEAMDTAQRGMGLDWPSSLELIKKTLDAARDVPGAFVASGAGTDHLSSHKEFSVQEIISAYEAQCASIEKLGGRIILMASRALAAPVEWDGEYGLFKVSPLLEWSENEIWEYIRKKRLPYNALHDRGFPSIGCAPCTRAVQPGEDERSGRWWWERSDSRECGLHPRRQVGQKIGYTS